MFGNLGLPELIVLFVIIMVLFGARKLPELGKGLGSGIRNFKSALNDSERGEIGDGRTDGEHVRGEVTDRSTTSR